MAYRKLHVDGIDFFIKSDCNKVTLKHCRYHLFHELLLYKVGFLADRIDGFFKSIDFGLVSSGHSRKRVAFFCFSIYTLIKHY